MHCERCKSISSTLRGRASEIRDFLTPDARRLTSVFHAFFISAFPNLPCASTCTCRSRPVPATMSIVISHLAAQPYSSIWHPTCT